MKGKFVKVKRAGQEDREEVISKWVYKFDMNQKTKVFLSVHQEDERVLSGKSVHI